MSEMLEELVLSLTSIHIADPKYKELILFDVKKTHPFITMDEIVFILEKNHRIRSEETNVYNGVPNKKINENSFIVPLQGKYLSDIKNDTSHLYYNQQKPGSSLSENQLPDNIKRK